jgi:hypothetical protein
MMLPWPLTTSTELAQVLRPGGHLRPDSALRTLRENGLQAETISLVPRSGRGARGRVVWYSSLMVDVVRLLRIGEHDAAAAIHREATRLAGHRAARFVAERLLEAGADPDPALLDAETGGALTRLATLTASARENHLASLGVESFVGRVADVSARVASVVAENGRTFLIPSLANSPSSWAGALISVDTELFAGGATTVWVRPAFDSEADPNERVPGGLHLLTPPSVSASVVR